MSLLQQTERPLCILESECTVKSKELDGNSKDMEKLRNRTLFGL